MTNVKPTDIGPCGECHDISTDINLYTIFKQVVERNPIDAGENLLKQLDVSGFETKQASYTQVFNCAELIASRLHQKLFKEQNELQHSPPVVTYMPASIERIAVMLAIWKLGVPLLPLDLKVPIERAVSIIKEATVKYVITSGKYEEYVGELKRSSDDQCFNTVKFTELVNDDENPITSKYTTPILSANFQQVVNKSDREDSLALILYTSGSTGVPKGVKLTHKNIISRLCWQWNKLPFIEGDVALQKTNALFIDSYTETFSAVGQLVPIVIVPSEIVIDTVAFINVIEQEKITRLVMVPSPWQKIINDVIKHSLTNKLKTLRTLILSGETLKMSLVQETFRIMQNTDSFQLVNLYGSSETTGDVLYHVFNRSSIKDTENFENSDVAPVGLPLWNTRIYILDELGMPVVPGKAGELYVSGDLISAGYLNASSGGAAFISKNNMFVDDGNNSHSCAI